MLNNEAPILSGYRFPCALHSRVRRQSNQAEARDDDGQHGKDADDTPKPVVVIVLVIVPVFQKKIFKGVAGKEFFEG